MIDYMIVTLPKDTEKRRRNNAKVIVRKVLKAI